MLGAQVSAAVAVIEEAVGNADALVLLAELLLSKLSSLLFWFKFAVFDLLSALLIVVLVFEFVGFVVVRLFVVLFGVDAGEVLVKGQLFEAIDSFLNCPITRSLVLISSNYSIELNK